MGGQGEQQEVQPEFPTDHFFVCFPFSLCVCFVGSHMCVFTWVCCRCERAATHVCLGVLCAHKSTYVLMEAVANLRCHFSGVVFKARSFHWPRAGYTSHSSIHSAPGVHLNSASLALGLQAYTTIPGLTVPHAHTASTLLTEPSPQPPWFLKHTLTRKPQCC